MPRMTTKRAIAARKSWQERAETWREKIGVSVLITRLEKHAKGEVDMTPTQVKAAQVLLDRVMPTLSASEIVRKNEPVNPEQLIQMLRERYGEEFASKLMKDYLPDTTHEAGHA
jgi:hypothetical protein